MNRPGFVGDSLRKFPEKTKSCAIIAAIHELFGLRPQSEKTPYVVLTHWDSEQAFHNWVGSDDFKLAHQNPMSKDAFLDGCGI